MITPSADLFCGAGGFSAGLIQACRELGRTPELLAVNHWPTAIATHALNHPEVSHLCENLDNVDPRKIVKNQRLEILLASPECTHHSRARGGKPMNDQSRASAWHVVRWAEALRVENIIVENVKEFETWAPLDRKGRPMKSKRGEVFRAWINALESLGYRVDYRVLNSAHYGAATARERLFIQACRRRRPVWPDRTHHDPTKERGLFDGGQPFRAAREIIDWSIEGRSIFGRERPLAPKTMKRILAGLKRFGGVEFVLGQQSCAAPRDVSNPLPTIATAGAISLVEPFLVVLRNHGNSRSIDEPLPTLCAGGGHVGLCEPFLVPVTHGGGDQRAHSLKQPMPTVTGAHRGEMALCEPFIVPYRGERDGQSPRCHSIDEPMPTVCTANGHALVEPFLVNMKGQSTAADINRPAPTVCAHARHLALAEPFLTKYYGTGGAASCDEPLDTITTNDRFGLCEPEPVASFERDGDVYFLMDIRFRMLQPHELAAAMGMEKYQFAGTKGDATKMIGNAVEVNTARALCKAVLQ